MERVRQAPGAHNSGHNDEKLKEATLSKTTDKGMNLRELIGRGEWIRTTDLLVPNQAL